MAGELKSGALLDPEAMVPASPDLAAEEDPASRQEGEHFSPRRRTVSTAAGGRPSAWGAVPASSHSRHLDSIRSVEGIGIHKWKGHMKLCAHFIC